MANGGEFTLASLQACLAQHWRIRISSINSTYAEATGAGVPHGQEPSSSCDANLGTGESQRWVQLKWVAASPGTSAGNCDLRGGANGGGPRAACSREKFPEAVAVGNHHADLLRRQQFEQIRGRRLWQQDLA
jgi:hypothetical protein